MRALLLLTLIMSVLLTPVVSTATAIYDSCKHGEFSQQSQSDTDKHHCCHENDKNHHCAKADCDCDTATSGSFAFSVLAEANLEHPDQVFLLEIKQQRLTYSPTSIDHPPSYLS